MSPDGASHYSACMMDDLLVEIDPLAFAVTRHFHLGKGGEHGAKGAPPTMASQPVAGAAMSGHAGPDPAARCSPTWAAPSPDGKRIYVACNAANEIVEIDAASWKLIRRVPAGDGVYNLAPTRDGRLLLATNKRGRSLSIFDAARGEELARIPTLRPIVHGIAISDDDRYAFISVEGYGAEPGTVEVIDLRARASVASVDVGQMAGGIAFWKSEPR